MIVRPFKAQNIREDDLIMLNDGDDRHFQIARVDSRTVNVPHKGLKTYRLRILMGAISYVNTYYENESVDKVVSL